VTNPFDNTAGVFRVLVNEANQHSLWPDFADVPSGWVVVHGPAERQSCVDYVAEHWHDITPIAPRDRVAS